jgi:hypothetical protein
LQCPYDKIKIQVSKVPSFLEKKTKVSTSTYAPFRPGRRYLVDDNKITMMTTTKKRQQVSYIQDFEHSASVANVVANVAAFIVEAAV